jgi:hypothetical protein
MLYCGKKYFNIEILFSTIQKDNLNKSSKVNEYNH